MIYEYLFFGIYHLVGSCFGLASFPYRHLFSEGPEKVNISEQTSLLRGRFFLDHGLHVAVADHGPHRNEYCLDYFKTQMKNTNYSLYMSVQLVKYLSNICSISI